MKGYVCFAGGSCSYYKTIKNKISEAFESLIKQGYSVFLDPVNGSFSATCQSVLKSLKNKYPSIEVYKCLTSTQYNKFSKTKIDEDENYISYFDATIVFNVEKFPNEDKKFAKMKAIAETCEVLVYFNPKGLNLHAQRLFDFMKNLNKSIVEVNF